MKLFYDPNDLPIAAKLGDRRIEWLRDLEAASLSEAEPDDAGFLFGYERGSEELVRQVGNLPGIRDQPDDRRGLLRLDELLEILQQENVDVPTPQTWLIGLDDQHPADLSFPLFTRTPNSSWKRGGGQSKVNNPRELQEEASLLRRNFGWDTPVLARRWLNLAVAGRWMFGEVPQEIRIWVVDGRPLAWSFHYLHVLSEPIGFPPSAEELTLIKSMAAEIASPFHSRLIAADFARDQQGEWWFLEAGPGAASGTAHERVFKAVAGALLGLTPSPFSDRIGGLLSEP